MKKNFPEFIIFTALILFNFITNVSAEEVKTNISDIEQKPVPLFQEIQDRTFKLNQQYTNNPIYSPFNSPFSQSRFVPNIAVILDTSYTYRNTENEEFENSLIPGFFQGGHHHLFNANNGFNLNYVELAIASVVDPYFDFFTNFHLGVTDFEIEEAYITTRNIPWGFQFKVGKFLSSFGRINSQHAHYWDFTDPTLVYDNLLGNHGIQENGLQVNWIAPIDTYLLLGAEVLQGTNEKSYGNQGFQIGTNKFKELNFPNLLTVFAKTSFDFEDLIILGGLSYAQGGVRINESSDNDESMHVHSISNGSGEYAVEGISRIAAADLTAKYYFDSYRYISWQSEYLLRNISGNTYNALGEAAYLNNQSGFYTQLIWKFNLQWRAGLRYGLIHLNNIYENNQKINNPGNLGRYTAMFDFNPTEFSRIRLQYNYDNSRFHDGENNPLHEVVLQLNMAIGAHGAHNF